MQLGEKYPHSSQYQQRSGQETSSSPPHPARSLPSLPSSGEEKGRFAKPNLRLRRERELRGWSQGKVAQEIGTDTINVSRWERGATVPSHYFRQKLCALFEKDAEELGLVQIQQPEPIEKNRKSFYTPPGVGVLPILDPMIPRVSPQTFNLVGRDALLTSLIGRIYGADGDGGLFAIRGLPGVGKTALAIALVQRPEIREYFVDGILWAGLGPRSQVLAHLSRWGALLDIPSTEMAGLKNFEDWGLCLRSRIGQRRMLLVLDDVWHMQDALALQVGGLNCTHVITTRFPIIGLHIAGEELIEVPELDEQHATALLAHFVPQIVERDLETVHTLIRLAGALPLALTVMGRYLQQHIYSGQPRRIKAAIERLMDAQKRVHLSLQLPILDQHPGLENGAPLSLQTILALSEQQLAEPARKALRALAVFPPKPATFLEEAAVAVMDQPVEILDDLCDAGLVENSGPQRYMLHQTIVDYMSIQPQNTQVYIRFILYMVQYVQTHSEEYESLQQECESILVAFGLAFEHKRWIELISGVHAFTPFLQAKGLYGIAREHLLHAYQAAQALESVEKMALTLLYLGEIEEKQCNYEQAEQHLQEGFSIAGQRHMSELHSRFLATLALLARHRKNHQQAEAYLQEGLAIARKLQQSDQIGLLLTNLGLVAFEQGNYGQAESFLQEGCLIAQSAGQQEILCQQLTILGLVMGERGDYTRSQLFLQQAFALAHALDYREWLCRILISLSALNFEQGNYEYVDACLQDGLHLAQQIGHRERICHQLNLLGALNYEQGNYEHAEEYLQEGLRLARELQHPQHTSRLLMNLGELAFARGDNQQALSYLEEALKLARSIGRIERISLALGILGLVLCEQGKNEQAQEHLQEGLRLARQIGHREHVSYLLMVLSILAERQCEDEQSEQYLEEGLTLARQIGHRERISHLLIIAGEMRLKRQQVREAEKVFSQAQESAPEDHREVCACILFGLARIAAERKDISGATRYARQSLVILEAIGHKRQQQVRQWLENLS